MKNAISKNQDNKQQSAVSQDTINRCSFKTVHLCCLDISSIPSIYKGLVSPNSSLVPKSKHLNCAVVLSATSSFRCNIRSPAPNKSSAKWHTGIVDRWQLHWRKILGWRITWATPLMPPTLVTSATQAYHKFRKCVICHITAALGIDAWIMTAVLWSWICTNKVCGYVPLASLAYK